MSERDNETPRHDADSRLGDLFENLPEPTAQIPTVDNSAPVPGSRRAAREAAAGESRPVTGADTPAEASPVPVRASADDAVAAAGGLPSPTPVRASADAADTPTRAVPRIESPSGAAATQEPVLGGGLDDLFVPHDDHIDAAPKKKRRKGCLIALIIVLVIFGGIAAAGVWVANTYGEKISDALGWGDSKDWEPGLATGEAFVTIKEGDTGSPVSTALYEAGVTKTESVFYDYLVDENIAVIFYPGVYKLQTKMTAEAALAALRDDANKLENTVSIPEGATIENFLPSVSETIGIPLEDLQAAVSDPTAYGVDADSLEGWLFPAVYTFDPEASATQVIQRMVDRTRESLAAAGVPAGDEQRVLTIASIIQREGRTDDFPKVSRVIENRLAPGNSETNGLLQMDSTAQYGVGELHAGAAGSSEKALTDPNPWNTYIHPGLPKGPIATATDKAIDAAMNPADGPWFYFVTVNLSTGETVFSATYAEQQQAEKKLHAWCKENPDAGCYAE
ncbi:endolytic transglycosylase MltG [Microbacterium sp. 3H14]|nr:endolytic transglycosylase MltG [Microbacterium sp. 3H14]